MSSLWLRKLALAGATLAPTSLAFSHYTQKPTQSSTALRATPLKQCVGGSWVESSSKATIDVEDPTTGALIGKVPEGTAADAHAALVAAKEAQPAWAKTAPAARGAADKTGWSCTERRSWNALLAPSRARVLASDDPKHLPEKLRKLEAPLPEAIGERGNPPGGAGGDVNTTDCCVVCLGALCGG